MLRTRSQGTFVAPRLYMGHDWGPSGTSRIWFWKMHALLDRAMIGFHVKSRGLHPQICENCMMLRLHIPVGTIHFTKNRFMSCLGFFREEAMILLPAPGSVSSQFKQAQMKQQGFCAPP